MLTLATTMSSMTPSERVVLPRTLRHVLCALAILGITGCAGPGFWARRGAIDAVEFVPGACLLAVAGRDAGTDHYDDHGDVKLYAVTDGTLVCQLPLPHRVNRLALDATGTWLAATSSVLRLDTRHRDALDVFRVSDPRNPVRCFALPDLPCIRGSVFSPDSRFLLVWGQNDVTVWRTGSWTRELTVQGNTRSAAFSVAGDLLAIARWNREVIEVWDLIEHRKITEMPGREPVVLDPSGRWWIYFDPRRCSLVFYLPDKRQEDFALPSPSSTCRGLALSATGALAAVVEEDRDAAASPTARGRVTVWDLRARQKAREFGCEVPYPFSAAFLNQGARLVIAGGRDPEVFDLGSGTSIGRLRARPTTSRIAAADNWVATHGSESVAVWDVGGSSPKLVWEDRWRCRPWSPLE